MGSLTAGLLATGIEALNKRKSGRGALTSSIGAVARYPLKLVASFFAAPFLAFRIASLAQNPIRRWIAGIGLFVSLLAAWFAGTFLGTMAGAILIAAKVGWILGLGFFVGSYLSLVFSAAFSIMVLNSVALLFVHMSSEEVIDYLRSISE